MNVSTPSVARERERPPCVPRVNTIIPTFPFIRSTPAKHAATSRNAFRGATWIAYPSLTLYPTLPLPPLSLSFLLPTLRGAVSNAISIFPARFIALSSPCHRRESRAPTRALHPSCFLLYLSRNASSFEGTRCRDRSHAILQRNFETETLEIHENDDRTRLKHSQLLPPMKVALSSSNCTRVTGL